MYSWYLDAVSTNWSGLVDSNSQTIFPITFSNKLGVKQFNQALFTREYDVVGTGFTIDNVVDKLQKEFKNIQFRNNNVLKLNKTERVYQFIRLNEPYSCNYSTNAKRLIKRSNKYYTYKVVNCIDELINLVKVNVAHKIKEFTPENINKLEVLMNNAAENNKGETIAVFENNIIVAAGFFLKDKSRITYLKGASSNEAKKNGAMYGLMDFAFSIYDKNYKTFDFGGSNVESVATFYKKFRAKDKIYFEYSLNNLPLWFKLLKKLKI